MPADFNSRPSSGAEGNPSGDYKDVVQRFRSSYGTSPRDRDDIIAAARKNKSRPPEEETELERNTNRFGAPRDAHYSSNGYDKADPAKQGNKH